MFFLIKPTREAKAKIARQHEAEKRVNKERCNYVAARLRDTAWWFAEQGDKAKASDVFALADRVTEANWQQIQTIAKVRHEVVITPLR